MTLDLGTRLGPYEIVALLGVGGMGEVYRARDTNLKREVAIKVLPASVAGDAERLARFQREAEVLAVLNHPGIAQIHGLEKSNNTVALVMELVEGPTLADKLASGSGLPASAQRALPIDEALAIARQIAEALEAAHERGIVHRDLKPANVKVRDDGTVKVLDFGLAKAGGAQGSGLDTLGDFTQSPTITTPAMTQAGVILGTASYMSPEQARGKPLDRRTDIWSFGCVLFEMLAGRRAFDGASEGASVTDVLAAILRAEPDWTLLPPLTTPTVRNVLRQCLQKDLKKRLRDIGDVQLALDGAFESSAAAPAAGDAPPPSRAKRWWLLLAATGAAAVAAIGTAGWRLLQPPPQPRQVIRFAVTPPASQPIVLNGFLRQLAISPDGTRIAYQPGGTGFANQSGGGAELIVRVINTVEVSPVRGTANAQFPFFSPDGRWVGYFSDGEIRKVPVAGGSPTTVCRYLAAPRGASWSADDTILFATNDTRTGVMSVPAGGGEPTILTTPDPGSGEQDHLMPAVSPDGHLVFFTVSSENGTERAQIAVLDVRTGQRKTLIQGNDATYVDAGPSRGVYLVYGSSGALSAVRFDPDRVATVGDPVRVVDQVGMTQTGATQYGVSREGSLAYVAGESIELVPRSLQWVWRDGRQEPVNVEARPYTFARLSPDETRVALALVDRGGDIWIYDFKRRTMTRLTSDPNLDSTPIWSPDGQRIVFSSSRSGPSNIYSQAADGTGAVVRLTSSRAGHVLGSFAPGGRSLVFRQFLDSAIDIMLLRFDPEVHVEPLLATPAVEYNPEISPDGRWLAYQSNEAGGTHVFVRPFPNVDGARYQISTGPGSRPAWSHTGDELFYQDPTTTAMMVVPVRTAGGFKAGNPMKLFDGPWYASLPSRSYDVSRDGRRLLMIKEGAAESRSTSSEITVVLGWLEELKQRVPTM